MTTLFGNAIETYYDGYRFRSALEARWAIFLQSIGVKFDYEIEGYELGGIPGYRTAGEEVEPMPNGTRYLPDFWLPDVYNRCSQTPGIWLEIKGTTPTEEEEAKCFALGELTKRPVVLAVGTPREGWEMEIYQEWNWWDNCMLFCKCHDCGIVKVEYSESNYMFCPVCNHKCDDDHPAIAHGIKNSRFARFTRW